MELGMIGLGKMGANMAERLLQGGHKVTGFDPSADARKALETQGGASADSLQALVKALPAPRVLWLMVPSGKITDDTVSGLLALLDKGDTMIDGGNSNYKDSLRLRGSLYGARASTRRLWDQRRRVGSEGGLQHDDRRRRGSRRGICGRSSRRWRPAKDQGWGRVGPAGSGHFVKMVHNGIEYGMMQAYAEGFSS